MDIDYDGDLESLSITSRQEIVFYLCQLLNDRERMQVLFDDGRESLLTVPIDLDQKNGVVVFDWGGNEEVSRRLLASSGALFVANPLGVRNLFRADRVWEIAHDGRPAFAIDIPKKYVRLQRRDFFRLVLPMTQRCQCVLECGEGATKKQWKFSVVDIGLGGCGIESADAGPALEAGQTIRRAVIDLGEFGQLTTDIEIRFARSINRGSQQLTRIGFRFLKLTPMQGKTLQHFVTEMQRVERGRI